MILFLALVVLVAILVFRALAHLGRHGGEHAGWHTGPQPPVGPTAEQILADRYARGEIEDEEYQRRLALLRSSRQGQAP
ncbi:SHOCT domain-containing protein [Streptomyces sp. CT34]|uniref:SHOCT domain-containing protein n=1 Tax=Streptomyces sp. CT34 TaxID=1553907 RepID=UPI00322092D6